jgi:N-glycosylase/DNA lyase
MPAEVGVAAFERVRSAGLLSRLPTERECEVALAEPLVVGGRPVRYRFPKQKARYLAEGLPKLLPPLSGDPLEAREYLRMLPGVGYKTASWIVRDWFASDNVAIIDVHIARACTAIGVFSARLSPERNYLEMETRFIAFARAIGARASLLDNIMWTHMRRDGNVLGARIAPDIRRLSPRPVNRKPPRASPLC